MKLNSKEAKLQIFTIGALSAVLIVIVAILFLRPEQEPAPGDAGSQLRNQLVRESVEQEKSSPGPERTRAVQEAPVDRKALEVSGFQLTVVAQSDADDTPLSQFMVQLFPDGTLPLLDDQRIEINGSDGEVSYQFENDSLPREALFVQVSAEGYATEIEMLKSPRGGFQGQRDRLEFTLMPGATIRGEVVDTLGRPVPSAEVGQARTVTWNGLRSDNPNEFAPSIKTDQNGIFELSGVPRDSTFDLIAMKEGYIPGVEEEVNADTSVKIVLQEGEASISGKVTNTEGEALAGIPVKAIYMNEGAMPDFRYPRNKVPNAREIYTRTEEDGSYDFPAILAGWQGIYAGEGDPVGSSVGERIFIDKGDHKTINLVMKEGYTLKGQVVDAATGNPMPAVRVSNMPVDEDPLVRSTLNSHPSRVELMSDGEGRFELPLSHTIEIEFGRDPTISYIPPAEYGNDMLEWQSFNVDREAMLRGDEVTIYLKKPLVLNGVVYADAEKNPAANTPVYLTNSVNVRRWGRNQRVDVRMPDTNSMEPAAYTNAQGAFQLELKRNERTAIFAETDVAGGIAVAHDPREEGGDLDQKQIEVFLKPMSRISGYVGSVAGMPLENVEITSRIDMENNLNVIYQVGTEATGIYQLSKQLPGRGVVSVEAPEGFNTPERHTIELKGGEDMPDVDFLLSEGVQFSGEIVNTKGEPVEGAQISMAPMGRNNWRRLMDSNETNESNANGEFTVENLEGDGGVYTIVVNHVSYHTRTINDVLLEDSPLTIELEEKPRLSFVVVDAGENQVTNFEYLLSIDGGFNWQSFGPRQFGRKIFNQTEPVTESVTEGKWTLHVYGIEGSGKRNSLYGYKEWTLEPGQSLEEEQVVVYEAKDVKGIVLTAEDEPLSDVEVELTHRGVREGGNFWGRRKEVTTRTDKDGEFIFENVEVGTVQLEARMEDLIQAERVQVDVSKTDEPEYAIIVMSDGGEIYGQVVDVDGEPLENATVRVSRDKQSTTDAEGNYRLLKLEARNYNVTLISPEGTEIESKRAEVAAQEEKQVDFIYDGYIKVTGQIDFRSNRPDRRNELFLSFEPTSGGEAVGRFGVDGSGQFETRMKPGDYEILVYTPGRNVSGYANIITTIDAQPLEQKLELPLFLETVDVSILLDPEAEMAEGRFEFYHRSRTGKEKRSEFNWQRQRFSVNNLPHGECRAVFTHPTAGVYISDWIPVDEGSEKILILIPESLSGG